jgi:HD superfamily phosphohydrolase
MSRTVGTSRQIKNCLNMTSDLLGAQGFDFLVTYHTGLIRSRDDKPGSKMASRAKPQRIRDPLHNLIEFDTTQFEQTIWRVIETEPFQRLRRVRQLGFSEFVFPGATHTRFAHSIGVFHTARILIRTIQQKASDKAHQAKVALAAALVHDIGHGMFSHAFEDIGKQLDLPMAIHENVGDIIVRNSTIKDILNRELGRGFADEVADVIKSKKPGNLFDAVVSSQFDADRLDYMQRDRLMTGVQGSGVDATWILANLEIGTVPVAADEVSAGTVETLVLGPKAFYAAEHYVLSLFQLYPNVYFHKTTRGAEKLFSKLMTRIYGLIRDGAGDQCGLPKGHSIYEFFLDPSSVEKALLLDDAVFWAALPLMKNAADCVVSDCARRLRERKLLKCLDVRRRIEGRYPVRQGMSVEDRREREARISLEVKTVMQKAEEVAAERSADQKQILIDEDKRSPYKKFQDSQTPLNQILIRQAGGFEDMANLSSVVSSVESYEINRIYLCEEDEEGLAKMEGLVGKERREDRNA